MSQKIFSPRKGYQKLKVIGHGKYGVVYQIVELGTGQISAIKVIKKASPRSKNESQIISQLDHPNIIKKIDDWNEDDTSYLVMEYAELGNLKEYIYSRNKIEEDEVRDLFKQIINGVEYAHRHKICHRDLKLENIVFCKDQDSPRGKRVVIIDWGFATSFSYATLHESFCGTPHYIAPEILTGQRYVGPEVDIWSLGVILYFLLTKHFPFKGDTLNEIRYKIYSGHPVMNPTWSVGLKNLLSRLLSRNSCDRILVQDIIDHPWMTPNVLEDNHIQKIESLVEWKRIYYRGEFIFNDKPRRLIRPRLSATWRGENKQQSEDTSDIIIRQVSSLSEEESSDGESEGCRKGNPPFSPEKSRVRKKKTWLSRLFRKLT